MDNNVEKHNLLIKDKGTWGQPALNIHRNFRKSQNQINKNPPTSILNFKRIICRNQPEKLGYLSSSFIWRLETTRDRQIFKIQIYEVRQDEICILHHVAARRKCLNPGSVSRFVSNKLSSSVHGPLCAWISPSLLCSTISLPSHLWPKILRVLCLEFFKG